MFKLNPNGCMGGFHGCSLVQSVAILSIVLQHPSERCKKLKRQLKKELEGYESAWDIYTLPENKSVKSVRYNLLKIIVKEMPDYKGRSQPDVTPIWKFMNSKFREGTYLNKIFSDFKDTHKSVDLKKTMDAILDILFNSENGYVEKKTENLWGLCLGEAERYLRCSNPRCRKLNFESASRFPFIMPYEPVFAENFQVPLEKVIRRVLEDHVDSMLIPPISEEKRKCEWETCGEDVIDTFACDTEFPTFFLAQINFLENVEKESQAMVTENKIVSVKGVEYAVVAKVAHLGNETNEGHYIMEIAENGGGMVTLNNENLGNCKPQSISRNDAYFLLFKVEKGGNPPPFAYFNTSETEESPMESVDQFSEISEGEDIEMKEALDFSDAYSLQRWLKGKENWESMPNALINVISNKLEDLMEMERLKVEDAITSFLELPSISSFSSKFRSDLKETIIKYMPKYLNGGGMEVTNWKVYIYGAFIEFDRSYFPQRKPYRNWRKVYEKYHKNVKNKIIPEIMRKNKVLSDNYVQSIEASMIKFETSEENRKRVRIIMDSLRCDAVETSFGNICFRNATDDRLKLQIGCHLTYSKCQRLEGFDKGTACLMSAARNKMQSKLNFYFFLFSFNLQIILNYTKKTL